jgi:hypothetical protein
MIGLVNHDWNIVKSGVKHHKQTRQKETIKKNEYGKEMNKYYYDVCLKFWHIFFLYLRVV